MDWELLERREKQEMEEKKFCPYCGEKLTGNGMFCGKCGKRITPLSEIAGTSTNVRNTKVSWGKMGAIIFIICCIVLGIFLYTHTDEKRILGTWMQVDEAGEEIGNSLSFNEDGTVLSNGMEGRYEIYDGEIDISYSDGWSTEAYTFEYELSGNQLTLTQEGTDNQATFLKRE